MKLFNNKIFWCLFLFCHLCLAENYYSKSSNHCAEELKQLENRFNSLTKISLSLDSLLDNSKNYLVPLKVIFQVDLSDSELIEKRIQELSKPLDFESFFETLKFSKSSPCSYSDLQQKIIAFAKEQEKINYKKIEFLKFETNKRAALLNSYESNRKNKSDLYGITNQLITSRLALSLAQQNLNDSEAKTTTVGVGESEELIIAQSALEKFNVDIELEHIKFTEALQEKASILEGIQIDLANFLKKPINNKNSEQLAEDYKFINRIWIIAADSILELFKNIKLESEVTLPESAIGHISQEKQTETIKKYSDSYLSAKFQQKTLSQARAKMLDELKIQDFKLLSDSGSLRAKILYECDLVNCERSRGLSKENLLILLREIKIVPLKFIAGALSKWIEIKSKISLGFDGWVDLGKQSLLLIVFFLIPIFLIKIMNWLSSKLEEIKKNLLSKSLIDYRSRTGFATWITRVNPFIPSLGMILSIQLARIIVEKTDLKEISGILFYFQVFFVYRAARMILMIILEIIFSSDSVASIKSQKYRIEKTATFVAKIIFLQYFLLHVTEDSVRRALAYKLFSNFIFWINLSVAFYEASSWQKEIKAAFKFRFDKIWKNAEGIFESKVGFLIIPLQFILIILHDLYRFLSAYLIRLDIVKKILSEVLRKRLESIDKKLVGGPPPKEYLKEFDYFLSANSEIFVDREGSKVNSTCEIIVDWINDKPTDDLIILVGNRGMGKTTALTHIHGNIKNTCQSLLFTVPPRITSKGDFYKWISNVLSDSIESIDDVKKFDSSLTQKLVLCVDDIQNLFIGEIGGFNAYKIFLEIISLKTKNIYWCLTVNSRAWSYLKGVFGPEHFYGKILTLSPWRDVEIQKLILSRHKQTNFKRSFDESIKAYGAGDSLGQQAEAQFFRLLWGQSRGNPRSALMYWISALTSPAPNEIHVGVPSFISSSAVGSMSDDALFILSAIARHENLTHDELRRVTRIEDTVIRKCLKEAANKNLIWIDDIGHARISSRAQYVIDYFLIGKNYLYE